MGESHSEFLFLGDILSNWRDLLGATSMASEFYQQVLAPSKLVFAIRLSFNWPLSLKFPNIVFYLEKLKKNYIVHPC